MDLGPVTEPHPNPSSSSSGYAFVSHSQESLPLNLFPSSTDNDNTGNNASFARRRRRRTSPHDQTILEEEYSKCTKPDKARRKEICKLVQMGEKEVQIWFCNKRQAQRRRATPLQPHEMVPRSLMSSFSQVASSQLSLVSSSPGRREPASEISVSSSSSSGFPISSSPVSTRRPSNHHHHHHHHPPHNEDAVTCELQPELHDDHHHHNHNQEHLEGKPKELDAADSQELLTATTESPQQSQQQTYTYTKATHTSTSTTSIKTSVMTKATASSTKITTQESKMTTTSAHRRLQDALNGSAMPEQSAPPLPPPIRTSNPRRTTSATIPPPRLLRRSSSAVRLTTSLEGKATVILEDEPSSSPPKPPPTPSSHAMKRRPLSTPVDSKLWEFCCDNQSAIQSPARIPPQPSEATQALRLLRTRRNTNIPSLPRTLSQSQSTKPSPPHPRLPPKIPAKKYRGRTKVITSTKKASRPKPLSSTANHNPKPHPHQRHRHHRTSFSAFEPSIDSDKENHPPGAPVSPPPERVLAKPRYQMPAEKRHDVDEGYGASQDVVVYEDEDASQNSGIARVSHQGRAVDEMECVENLLSLRGGTWR